MAGGFSDAGVRRELRFLTLFLELVFFATRVLTFFAAMLVTDLTTGFARATAARLRTVFFAAVLAFFLPDFEAPTRLAFGLKPARDVFDFFVVLFLATRIGPSRADERRVRKLSSE